MLKNLYKAWFGLLLCFFLTGCMSSSFTQYESSRLYLLRKYAGFKVEDKNTPHFKLVYRNTEYLVKENAKKKDFALYSLAMGYKAKEENAVTVGAKCEGPVEKTVWFTGCFPPPAILMKLMYVYNTAIMDQPDFPKAWECIRDDKMMEGYEKGIKEEEEYVRKSTKESIEKWKEKRKKSLLYND
ncbi:MAG: hypothetical protein HND56_06065 [Pseudomonadota bacterium]|nr:MAG: hypothetical protein HND56_06065 [Pseudomonadota bacterium]